jgi:hypothetical protein
MRRSACKVNSICMPLITHPIPSAEAAGFGNGAGDAAEVTLKVHGPLIQIAGGQDGHTLVSHCVAC